VYGAWPGASASKAARRSQAVRANGPTVSKLSTNGKAPRVEIVPKVGRRPKIPQSAAGTRIEPFVSDASASGTSSAATAAADPPDEPPAMRVRSCGLCVGPSCAFSVTNPYANSSMFVTPTRIAPARSSEATASASLAAGGSVAVTFAPARVTTPATSKRFLAANGTPASGPGSRPRAMSASMAAARAIARSANMPVKALRCSSRAAMRAIAAAMT
jgi:hypothetical protein